MTVNLAEFLQLTNLLLIPAVVHLVILERRLTKLETLLELIVKRRRHTDEEDEQ